MTYALAILQGLQRKPMYMGTVSYVEKIRRRNKNKIGRAQNRLNRLLNKGQH